MSFSSDVKNEIVKKYTDEKSAISELSAMVCFGGKFKKEGEKYLFYVLSENPKTARRVYSLMKGSLEINSRIRIKKTSDKTTFYEVVVSEISDIEKLFKSLCLIGSDESLSSFVNFRISPKMVSTPERQKAFLKGAFIVSGSVINPLKNYHLEFTTSRFSLANDFMELLEQMGIGAKLVTRKSKYVVYYKNSEDITDVLTMLGAVNALMDYHNTKIVKEMRNRINRTINCETANLNKTVDASMEQVQSIQKLMDNGVFDTLPDTLKDVAKLRLEYREHSLKELGELLTPPIGKSGVNHRLRKIIDIANEI